MQKPTVLPTSVASSSVKISSPPGRNASAAEEMTSSSDPKYTRVSTDTIRSNASFPPCRYSVNSPLTSSSYACLSCSSEHVPRQIDADQPACIGRNKRTAQPGATPGIEHIEALRCLDARIRQHRCDQRRSAV